MGGSSGRSRGDRGGSRRTLKSLKINVSHLFFNVFGRSWGGPGGVEGAAVGGSWGDVEGPGAIFGGHGAILGGVGATLGVLRGVARGPEREKDQCGNEKRIKRFSVIFTAHCSSNTCVEWWIVFSLVFLYGAADTADAVDMHA